MGFLALGASGVSCDPSLLPTQYYSLLLTTTHYYSLLLTTTHYYSLRLRRVVRPRRHRADAYISPTSPLYLPIPQACRATPPSSCRCLYLPYISPVSPYTSGVSCDPAVIVQMRAVAPLMAATLCLHGTAVTLEG